VVDEESNNAEAFKEDKRTTQSWYFKTRNSGRIEQEDRSNHDLNIRLTGSGIV
jgi:hypothetical protein